MKYHYGTDLAADTGTPITAFADGMIVAQGDSDSFGKYVMIDHPDGYRTLYAHCSAICMNCGEVKKGDVIALVGSTGAATGPHLHFELEKDDVYLNPEFYILNRFSLSPGAILVLALIYFFGGFKNLAAIIRPFLSTKRGMRRP